MKHSLVFALLSWLVILLAGCASTPTGSVMIGNISDLPQTELNGAKLVHARAVAMGQARAKGWAIEDAAPNQLRLSRSLPAGSPQAATLDSTLAPPRVEVETNLAERQNGTIVALRAFLISNPGTEKEQRIDYTRDYESQLLISLSSLQSAWLASGTRVASAVPAPTPLDEAEQAESRRAGDSELAATAGLATTAGAQPSAAPPAAAEPTPAPARPSPRVAQSAPAPEPMASRPRSSPRVAESAPAPEPMPARQRSSRRVVESAPAPARSERTSSIIEPSEPVPSAIVETEPPTSVVARGTAPRTTLPPASGIGLPATTTPAVASREQPAGGNNMLVLDTSARKGLWAYYAEDYARLRGCSLGDRGAVLLQETDTFELHEVECAGAANMLVKCQGGICQAMR